jgi:hypothetical protein
MQYFRITSTEVHTGTPFGRLLNEVNVTEKTGNLNAQSLLSNDINATAVGYIKNEFVLGNLSSSLSEHPLLEFILSEGYILKAVNLQSKSTRGTHL